LLNEEGARAKIDCIVAIDGERYKAGVEVAEVETF